MYTAIGMTEQDYLKQGIQAMPPCYSRQLHDCLKTEDPKSMPGCDDVTAGYTHGDWDAMEAKIQSLPYCDAPVRGLDVATRYPVEVGVSVASGVLLGLLVASLI